MAQKLQMSQNNYSRLESGDISITIERLRQLSQVLEVPLAYFWGGVENTREYEVLINFFKTASYKAYDNYLEKIYIEAIYENRDLLQYLFKNKKFLHELGEEDKKFFDKQDLTRFTQFLEIWINEDKNKFIEFLKEHSFKTLSLIGGIGRINRYTKEKIEEEKINISRNFNDKVFNDSLFKILLDSKILNYSDLANLSSELNGKKLDDYNRVIRNIGIGSTSSEVDKDTITLEIKSFKTRDEIEDKKKNITKH